MSGDKSARRPAHRAFTLVELLTVIGIIALLIGVLLPVLNKARASANCLACQANLHQIGQALQIYLVNSKGVLPFGYWDGTFNVLTGRDTGFNGNTAADWSVLLQSALSASNNYNSVTPVGVNSKAHAIFLDPEAPQGASTNTLNLELVQYATHPRLMPAMPQDDKLKESSLGGQFYLQPYNSSHIKRASEIMLIFDATLVTLVGGGWSVHDDPVAQTLDNGRLVHDTYLTDQYDLASETMTPSDPIDMNVGSAGPLNADTLADSQNVRFRHLKDSVCNALMADMHVQSFHFQLTATGQYKTDLLRSNIYVNP